jgi:hypothetical protein
MTSLESMYFTYTEITEAVVAMETPLAGFPAVP